MIIVTILFKSGASVRVKADKVACDISRGRMVTLSILGMKPRSGVLLDYNIDAIDCVAWRDAHWWERWF